MDSLVLCNQTCHLFRYLYLDYDIKIKYLVIWSIHNQLTLLISMTLVTIIEPLPRGYIPRVIKGAPRLYSMFWPFSTTSWNCSISMLRSKKHELEIDFKAYTNGSLECSVNNLIKHQSGLPFLLQIGDVFVPFPNLPSCRHLPLLAM